MESCGLHLRLFGPFEATFQGELLPTPRTRKAVSLLALLALRAEREVERSFLAGTLWPESDATTGQTNLRQTLAILRGTLGPAADRLIATNRRVLCLHLSGSDHCDIVAFDRLVARWERTQDISAAEQAVLLGNAGPLLEDSGEDWTIAERARREAQLLTLLEGLAAAALDTHEYARACVWAEQAVRRDPFHEPTQRLLYRALGGNGDLAAARRAYRDFRLNLYQETRQQPDAETTALIEQLVNEAENKTVPVTSSAVPVFLTTFLGRVREREEVLRYLSTPGVRLITLLGVGGIGKTRLALSVAEHWTARTGSPLPFVDLASLTVHATAADILDAIAAVLVLPPSAHAHSVRDTIVAASPAFLLLDNCEHLDLACRRVVQDLLQACPSLRILATSRHTLGVPGEVRWAVPPLAETEAVQLFHQRTAAVRPDQEEATEEGGTAEEEVRELCRRLDALPLALELAAARRNVLSVAQIIERLGGRFRLLADANALPDARQGTLQATLAWSWDLLTVEERRCLSCLSVFSGGWNLEAARAVAFPEEADEIAAIDILSRLANRSLISVRAKEGRGIMLETIRQYAREQATPQEFATAQARHVQFFLELARADDELLQVGSERDNLRAALEYAEPDTALSLCVALGEFYLVRGYAEEGSRRYEELLSVSSATHPERSAALYQAGRLFQAQGDNIAARRCFEEAIGNIDPSEGKLRIRLLGNLGLCVRDEKDFHGAERLFRQALELAEATEDRVAMASLTIRLGILAFDRADFPEAANRLDAAVLLASQSTKTAVECAVALTLRGDVARNLGQHREAIDFYTRALPTHIAYGYQAEMARTHLGMGQSRLLLEEFEAAREHLLQARELFEQLKDAASIERVMKLLEVAQ